ncbi:hypothetical protein [Streptomyces aidingensis]|uniref:Integral membrane protein n=1 Tax=Streptomyces aidingensis TaxID=910347 RepID=A0A1I1RVL0_9ACTN|nr:hypothetical protein [Streptomyces aidingensis]SFD38376.1 hypothetical protein SAMN05421773_11445 [Streptomyces aidingensis]
MLTPLTVALAVTALLLAAWCGLAALRGQPTKDWHFGGMAVVSLLAVGQLVIGVVLLARGERPAGDTTAVLVSYLLTVALCVPVTGLVSLGERTRWGSATVAVGALTVPALQLRLHDIWGGGLG